MGIYFLLYPIAEVLAWASLISRFGFFNAFFWCLTSALVGLIILRMLGGTAFRSLQASAQRGELPSKAVTHRLLMSLGGVLLVLPGVITDVMGALLILPITSHFFVWWIYKRTKGKINAGFAGFTQGGPLGGFVFRTGPVGRPTSAGPRDVTPNTHVIDVKATHVEDK